jgi:hypothetical protein
MTWKWSWYGCLYRVLPAASVLMLAFEKAIFRDINQLRVERNIGKLARRYRSATESLWPFISPHFRERENGWSVNVDHQPLL